MPTYQNVTPPLAIFPGDVGFSWSNEAFPANGTAGQQFALTFPAGLAESGHTVRWQTIFGGAPTAVNIIVQTAMSDVDAEYTTIDTSTATTGEARTITGVIGKFMRAKLAAAEQNHQDDTLRLAAISKERDTAVKAARGGSFWQRTRRAIKWFAIGAGAGAIAATSSRH